MEEIWKEIKNTNGLYFVSNLGNVKKGNKSIKKTERKDGYVKVRINYGDVIKHSFVHRLVALAFIPNPNDLPQVNHIDGDKTNNAVTNLEWCTEKENQKHRIEILHKDMIGENNPMFGVSGSKSPVYKGLIYQHDIKTGEIINSYEGSGKAAEAVGGKAANIIRVLNLPTRSYKGYRWTREN